MAHEHSNEFYMSLAPGARPKFLRITEAAAVSVRAFAEIKNLPAVPILWWDNEGDPRFAAPPEWTKERPSFAEPREWEPVNGDGSPWSVEPAPKSNVPNGSCQLSVEPVGKGDPRWDEDALASLFADFLLNSVKQADDVSVALVARFAKRQIKNALVFAKKQHDYGPGNIAASGEVGIFVRFQDKVARIDNLRGREAMNEGIGDSWLDCAVYAPMAQMVREGEWPGCKERDLLVPRPKVESANDAR